MAESAVDGYPAELNSRRFKRTLAQSIPHDGHHILYFALREFDVMSHGRMEFAWRKCSYQVFEVALLRAGEDILSVCEKDVRYASSCLHVLVQDRRRVC